MQTQVKLENESIAMVANLEYAISEEIVLDSAFENGGTAADSKVNAPSQFRNHFVGYMDLYADAATAIAYLDAHQGWFCRCAQPLKVKSISRNAYALGIGHVGALGYKVDPRIGLDLLPQKEGVYRIQSIPVPDQEPQAYEVDFQAVMIL